MSLSAVLIFAALLAIAGILVAIARAVVSAAAVAGDTRAPRGHRVVVTDVDDDSIEGFLVHEDRHRLVLEGASLLQADRRIEMAGRQHFRTSRVKRVQELSD